MKRIFFLGVVATVIFSMAACSNDDTDVGVNARRAERPRSIEVTISADETMAAVTWVAGRDTIGNHEVVARMVDANNNVSNTIAVLAGTDTAGISLDVNSGDYGHPSLARLPVVGNNVVQGGRLAFSGNTLTFSNTGEDGSLDRFSVVVSLKFASVAGNYEIGVRSGHYDSIEATTAMSDILWRERGANNANLVSFAAASAFIRTTINESAAAQEDGFRSSFNNANTTGIEGFSRTEINLPTATRGVRLNAFADSLDNPTMTNIRWQVQDSRNGSAVWIDLPGGVLNLETFMPRNATTNPSPQANIRAVVLNGDGLNQHVNSSSIATITVTRSID